MCLESPSLRSLPDVFLFALWVSVESTVGQKSQDHPGHVLLPAASMTVLLNLLLGMVSVHTFHCMCLHTSQLSPLNSREIPPEQSRDLSSPVPTVLF